MALTKQNIANVLEELKTTNKNYVIRRYEIYGYLQAALQHFDVISPFPEDVNYIDKLFEEITIKHWLFADVIRIETKGELLMRLATDLIK